MGKIHVLDLSVANLIAAGEVVDRPASAIKEMMENSIDAGATEITVEIKNGGSSLMRVTDNGCGMDAEDAQACIHRHATSKIRQESDLDAIMTLGFRGEALAAIASVTEFRILTRRPQDEMGTLVRVENGEIVQFCPIGCPSGTTVIAETLFANIPARRKFLKKDITETGAVASVVEKVALSHPEIAVRLICDEKIKFSSAGDGKLLNTIHAILGRDFAKKLVPVDDETEGIRIYGYIGRPDNVRGNRNCQNFFINGRYIKSTTAAAALEQAFVSYCPAERFPCCVLNMVIHPALVDVNVHPSKLEVKFSNEKLVFHAVYCAVRNALTRQISRPEAKASAYKVVGDDLRGLGDLITYKAESAQAAEQIALDREKLTVPYRQITTFDEPDRMPAQKSTVTVETAEEEAAASAVKADTSLPLSALVPSGNTPPDREYGTPAPPVGEIIPFSSSQPPCISDHYDPVERMLREAMREKDTAIGEDRLAGGEKAAPPATPEPSQPKATVGSSSPRFSPLSDSAVQSSAALTSEEQDPPAPSQCPPTSPSPIPPYRIGGVLFQCYIVVELENRMLLIDKHAAHERILFEQLKANMVRSEAFGQILLLPISVPLSATERGAAEEYAEEIRAIGFDFIPPSPTDDAILLTQIPSELEQSAASDAFSVLLGNLAEGTGTAQITRRSHCEKALFQASCKAAMKAGREDSTENIRWVVEQVLSRDDIRFCPHGRPVALEMTKSDVEHLFHRP